MTITMKYRSENSQYNNPVVLNKICELVSGRLDELMDLLGVEYTKTNKFLVGPCPVHNGDNYTAFNLFPDGNSAKSNWVCYTNGCHKSVKNGGFGNTIFGLVRGINSSRGKTISWEQAVDFVCSFLKININDIKVNESEVIARRTSRQLKLLNEQKITLIKQYDTKILRELLTFPAQYYINRGYSREILDKYDVGYCNNPDKPFFQRCVFPIFNDDKTSILGFTARSVFEKCERCSGYHDKTKTCPSIEDVKRGLYSKWKNSLDFYTHKQLFNYWYAKDSIKDDKYAILVEGPGDCMKLEELGVKNSLGLFGSYMSDEQYMLLEQLGATTLIVMTDNDKAGKEAASQIKSMCGRLYRLYFPKFSGKDAGDFNRNTVTNEVQLVIDKVKNTEKI